MSKNVELVQNFYNLLFGLSSFSHLQYFGRSQFKELLELTGTVFQFPSCVLPE